MNALQRLERSVHGRSRRRIIRRLSNGVQLIASPRITARPGASAQRAFEGNQRPIYLGLHPPRCPVLA